MYSYDKKHIPSCHIYVNKPTTTSVSVLSTGESKVKKMTKLEHLRLHVVWIKMATRSEHVTLHEKEMPRRAQQTAIQERSCTPIKGYQVTKTARSQRKSTKDTPTK